MGEHLLLATPSDEIEHLVDRDAPDQLAVGVDDRRRHQVVALERARRHLGFLVPPQLDRWRLHHVGDARLGLADDDPVQGQHAEQALVLVDDEQLVRLRRKLLEAAQVAQHDLEGHIGAHLHVVEVHQGADHVLVEGHGSPQLIAIGDREAAEHIVHHLLRQVGGERGDLVGRQRLEDPGDVSRMEAGELLRQLGPGSLRDRTRRGCFVGVRRRGGRLVLDQSFDEALPAQQRRDLGERVLHALARLGALGHPRFEAIGHRRDPDKFDGAEIGEPRFYGNSADGIRARMIPILRFNPGAPWWYS